jgi:hypothetical protein
MCDNHNDGIPTTRIVDAAQPCMSACDKLTMDTMINTVAYSKYVSRKMTEKKTQSDETKSERRFYKKRIMDLTKQLIKNPTHTNDPAVINACSTYIHACIMHFKFIDLSDTLQSEHHGQGQCADNDTDANSNQCSAGAAVMQHEDFTAKVNEIDTAYLMDDAKHVKKISIPEKNVLERLFISPDPPAGLSEPPSLTGSAAIPRVVSIDFSDQQFKTKGVKKSKQKQ